MKNYFNTRRKRFTVLVAILIIVSGCAPSTSQSQTIDINQIVTATLQALTREAEQVVVNNFTETPIPNLEVATSVATPTAIPVPEKDGFDVVPQPNLQDENKTDVYIRDIKTGDQWLFITLEDVNRDHYHFAEYHDGNLYLIKRIGNDKYPSNDWTDELWRYSSSGDGKRIYSVQGLDFRVSPNQNLISINFNPSGFGSGNKLFFINNNGKVVQKFKADQLGELGDYFSMPVKWSDDGNYFWGALYLGPSIKYFYRANIKTWDIESYNVTNLTILTSMDCDLNPDTGDLVYSDYPALFDSVSLQAYKDSGQIVTLFLYNLYSHDSKVISTSITKAFRPTWLGENMFEYNDPNTNGRLIYVAE